MAESEGATLGSTFFEVRLDDLPEVKDSNNEAELENNEKKVPTGGMSFNVGLGKGRPHKSLIKNFFLIQILFL